MNVLIKCSHTGLGNLFMFLQAIDLAGLQSQANWFHDSRHFRHEPIEFALPYLNQPIDFVFLLYPNFFVVRKIEHDCPVLGFHYKIKGIYTKLFLTKALRWNQRISEVTNNLSLLMLWQEYYCRSAATPAIN